MKSIVVAKKLTKMMFYDNPKAAGLALQKRLTGLLTMEESIF